jgi:hypothetical protein
VIARVKALSSALVLLVCTGTYLSRTSSLSSNYNSHDYRARTSPTTSTQTFYSIYQINHQINHCNGAREILPIGQGEEASPKHIPAYENQQALTIAYEGRDYEAYKLPEPQ